MHRQAGAGTKHELVLRRATATTPATASAAYTTTVLNNLMQTVNCYLKQRSVFRRGYLIHDHNDVPATR